MTDAFECSMEFIFDVVTHSRKMPLPYWRRVGFGKVSGVATKRQRRLCERSGHPRYAGITRDGVTACGRCRKELPDDA